MRTPSWAECFLSGHRSTEGHLIHHLSGRNTKITAPPTLIPGLKTWEEWATPHFQHGSRWHWTVSRYFYEKHECPSTLSMSIVRLDFFELQLLHNSLSTRLQSPFAIGPGLQFWRSHLSFSYFAQSWISSSSVTLTRPISRVMSRPSRSRILMFPFPASILEWKAPWMGLKGHNT